MACALVLAAFWILGIVVVLALCKAAKRGDLGISAEYRRTNQDGSYSEY